MAQMAIQTPLVARLAGIRAKFSVLTDDDAIKPVYIKSATLIDAALKTKAVQDLQHCIKNQVVAPLRPIQVTNIIVVGIPPIIFDPDEDLTQTPDPALSQLAVLECIMDVFHRANLKLSKVLIEQPKFTANDLRFLTIFGYQATNDPVTSFDNINKQTFFWSTTTDNIETFYPMMSHNPALYLGIDRFPWPSTSTSSFSNPTITNPITPEFYPPYPLFEILLTPNLRPYLSKLTSFRLYPLPPSSPLHPTLSPIFSHTKFYWRSNVLSLPDPELTHFFSLVRSAETHLKSLPAIYAALSHVATSLTSYGRSLSLPDSSIVDAQSRFLSLVVHTHLTTNINPIELESQIYRGFRRTDSAACFRKYLNTDNAKLMALAKRELISQEEIEAALYRQYRFGWTPKQKEEEEVREVVGIAKESCLEVPRKSKEEVGEEARSWREFCRDGREGGLGVVEEGIRGVVEGMEREAEGESEEDEEDEGTGSEESGERMVEEEWEGWAD